jgi:hypothetical protein
VLKRDAEEIRRIFDTQVTNGQTSIKLNVALFEQMLASLEEHAEKTEKYRKALEREINSCYYCIGTGMVSLGNHPKLQEECRRCKGMRQILSS